MLGLFKSDEEKIKECIQNGLDYVNKNEFEKVLKIGPKNQDGLFNLGFVYSDMENFTNAYEIFKRLVKSKTHKII